MSTIMMPVGANVAYSCLHCLTHAYDHDICLMLQNCCSVHGLSVKASLMEAVDSMMLQ